jgi:hypothetical protein
MRVNNIFPISLARFTIDKEIIDNSIFLVRKFIKDTNFADNPPPGELLTTFYKDKDFLGNLGDRPLLDCINGATRQYLEILGLDPKCYIEITSWLQYNPPGSYFVRHDHYGALISGCLYLNVPEKSGNVLFHNPLEARRVTNTFFERIKKEENDYNFSHVKYEPIVGEMIMFEAWLQHTVTHNHSEEDRIAVGFNIWADRDVKN